MNRIEREFHALEVMIGMYCRRRHGNRGGDACGECGGLLEYARERLRSCRYGEAKPVCSRCRTSLEFHGPAVVRKPLGQVPDVQTQVRGHLAQMLQG